MLSHLLFLRIKNIFSIENILKYARLFYLCDTIQPRDIAVEAIVPHSRGRASACIFFAVFAHSAVPAELHYAQKLQKIFPVAEGDPSQGLSCSVEQEYCPSD